MKIIDENGRIGVVTQQLEGGSVFAKPEGTQYIINDDEGVTGISGAKLITATYWTLQPDERLHGLWHDSRLGDFRFAKLIKEEV